jgi:hypothetical protein
VINSSTAYKIGNDALTRFYTKDKQTVSMDLPARFYTLELYDYVKVQHPILIGSQSTFQITRLSHDYMKGKVKITADEVLN